MGVWTYQPIKFHDPLNYRDGFLLADYYKVLDSEPQSHSRLNIKILQFQPVVLIQLLNFIG